ncbi:hypothetical protein P691DRAFT_810734 [Macrolepiota fuliginosa MF-IS2]|uniref:Uncharacterized protein n=1 Tax=Macrolepiota fuliginosa MF-IS2 TaxID=1400762 RepID=A0A9P5X363_9AGAR|nr:hypothetical protein P691DRAFT_810734 [Macrolepiota fuliginosa MF-IS2]
MRSSLIFSHLQSGTHTSFPCVRFLCANEGHRNSIHNNHSHHHYHSGTPPINNNNNNNPTPVECELEECGSGGMML